MRDSMFLTTVYTHIESIYVTVENFQIHTSERWRTECILILYHNIFKDWKWFATSYRMESFFYEKPILLYSDKPRLNILQINPLHLIILSSRYLQTRKEMTIKFSNGWSPFLYQLNYLQRIHWRMLSSSIMCCTSKWKDTKKWNYHSSWAQFHLTKIDRKMLMNI